MYFHYQTIPAETRQLPSIHLYLFSVIRFYNWLASTGYHSDRGKQCYRSKRACYQALPGSLNIHEVCITLALHTGGIIRLNCRCSLFLFCLFGNYNNISNKCAIRSKQVARCRRRHHVQTVLKCSKAYNCCQSKPRIAGLKKK